MSVICLLSLGLSGLRLATVMYILQIILFLFFFSEDRSVVDNAADSITAKLSSILTAMLAVIFVKMWRV